MGLVVAVAAMVAGFAVAVLASRVAVTGANSLVARTRLPPFIVGMTLVALGTDLPEMVNSIAASVQGLGDVNVGDSIGSVVTQITLVLGLMPLLGGALLLPRRRSTIVGVGIVGALLVGAALMRDGDLSRFDGAVLVGSWVLLSFIVWRFGGDTETDPPEPDDGSHLRALAQLAVGLAIITVGVMAAIWGVVRLADAAGVPVFLVSFFGASLGTSLPELLFSVTALRRGHSDMAVGDALGASMVDATLSIGIGPLVAPTLVSTSLVERGVLVATASVVFAVALLLARGRHTRVTGAILVGMYLAVYVVLLA
ncbi:sodium:calcium antiporter [Gordonia rhizosphera]|uniref:Putative transporter n=1 Tax=Gordonia rhizosphera NBRC 16068 TaxID=1108045 RepID=K6WIZ1_9ACTN|nr:sodium:calcium antiporter [Gordonia rhizosphera]GAB92137.1 putative transporter [Gordonia rhizosphera NBRC 16068]